MFPGIFISASHIFRVGSGFSPTKFDPDDRKKSVSTCLIHVHSLVESDELHFVGPPSEVGFKKSLFASPHVSVSAKMRG